MGVESERLHAAGNGWSPVYAADNIAVVSIAFLLPSADEAVIWRGPKKNGLIKQFLKDVAWGEIDYLVVDTPPGTSDEHLSLAQYLKATRIDGAVVLTTPQVAGARRVGRPCRGCTPTPASRRCRCSTCARKSRFAARLASPSSASSKTWPALSAPTATWVTADWLAGGRMRAPCTHQCSLLPCGQTESAIFPPTTGGAAAMATDMGVPFLGRVPLDPRIGKCCDEGVSFVQTVPDSPAAEAYRAIVKRTSVRRMVRFVPSYVRSRRAAAAAPHRHCRLLRAAGRGARESVNAACPFCITYRVTRSTVRRKSRNPYRAVRKQGECRT